MVRLAKRRAGFIVARENPKHLTTWGSLLHEGVRLANRPKGWGARALLDEKLVSMEARAVKELAADDSFKRTFGGFDGYSTTVMGAVVYKR